MTIALILIGCAVYLLIGFTWWVNDEKRFGMREIFEALLLAVGIAAAILFWPVVMAYVGTRKSGSK